MKYKQISIEEHIKDFKAFRPKEQTISEFENELNQFLINAKKEDSEEYQKNEINKFLNKVFDYDCNVKGKIDSAIYEYGEPRVIFETKKINNKAEFVKENSNNLESKAFYESILYFLRENITNKNIRRALAIAFDRNYIISNVIKMDQIPAGAFVTTGMKDYDGKDFRENGGNYIDVDNYQKNVEEAKRLFAEAGYPNGEGFPVLELRSTPGYFTIICEAIQEMYKNNLGIDIFIKSEEYNTTYQAMVQKDYDLARSGWNADFSDPMSVLNFFSKESAVNHTGFESEEFYNLMEFAAKTQNQKDRMEALHKAEDILFDYMPIIPLIYKLNPYMINPKLKGVVYSPLGRYRFNYAYIEK